jgi:glycosyl-4,4'-diaponeurosporenoate acyltransferase
MSALVWTANILGWPLIHLALGSLAVRLPRSLFEKDNWITAPRAWERSGHFYREWLRIRAWKSKLPDGAPRLGGKAKKIFPRIPASLNEFILETRRAELAHWAMLCCAPLYFLWNPPWARLVMIVYAVAANLPCILAQRYNRAILDHVLRTCRHPFIPV